MFSLSLQETGEVWKRMPGPLLTGTRVEMERLAAAVTSKAPLCAVNVRRVSP